MDSFHSRSSVNTLHSTSYSFFYQGKDLIKFNRLEARLRSLLSQEIRQCIPTGRVNVSAFFHKWRDILRCPLNHVQRSHLVFSKVIQVNKTYIFPKNRLHPKVVAYGLLYEIISFISLLSLEGMKTFVLPYRNSSPKIAARGSGIRNIIWPPRESWRPMLTMIRHQTTHKK